MSQTYTSKPKDMKPEAENPFVGELMVQTKGKVKSKTKGRVMQAENGFVSQRLGVHDLTTGDILEDESLVVAVKKAVDTEHFVKLYLAGMTALFDLSRRAYDVAVCLLKAYNQDRLSGTNDLVYFNHNEAVECGYKKKWHTFRSGLNELMHYKFLCPAKKGPDWYWINPTLFYRGDRLTVINQYVLGEECKTAPDPKLDQIDLFDGKTEREKLAEGQKRKEEK